ncbi:MAG: Flp pilus assembly complex ATPase component TadA, partial [Gemmatimonadota bacterium]|nr:Flp pilus assembly complex ATPase component TadA [Gemmatimonadota bacterium]
AQIALQASLTGHLVLSTLHTNDAPNAVTRLVDIGMEAYKIAPALRGVVAQRLMRRLCRSCRVPMTDEVSDRLKRFIPAGQVLCSAVGCTDCSMTGYRGRFSIVEVLTMNPELERQITEGAAADRIAEAARAGGMRSLFASGLRHVLSGESTIEELLRVTEPPPEEAAARPEAAPVKSPRSTRVSAPHVSPRAESTAPPVSLDFAMDLLEAPAQTDEVVGAGKGQGACVLLVEDEEQLRRVMKDLLQREGYRVAEARDGIQALDEVDRHAPDVIILDLNLPGLDGYSVLAQLRSRPATRGIPIMVLTAKGDEDNEVRVFELGAVDFVTKPFRARSLTARLEAVLGRHRT